MAKKKKRNVTVNYNGEPLKPNEVLVLSHQDDLFIRTNVTNPDSIVTVTIAGVPFKAVLMAVDRKFEKIAKAQFNSWQNEEMGHLGHRMKDESIEDRQERELPERGQTRSAEDEVIEKENLLEKFAELLKADPQSACAAMLKAYGVTGAEFEVKMKLKHNASNKAQNKMMSLLETLMADQEVDIRANKTDKTEYYLKVAEELLAEIISIVY